MTIVNKQQLNETVMATTKTKKVSGLLSAHISEFIYNPENLRENLDRPELREQLKADKLLLNPLIVYPESFNINGKKVLFEGNSRVFNINKLIQDGEWLGSEDCNYTILPEDIAGDKLKERLFMLSLGTTNQRLSQLEQAKAYQTIIQDYIESQKAENLEAFEALDEKKKALKIKNWRIEIRKILEKETGKSERYFGIILAVLENAEKNSELKEALENDIISVRNAELLEGVAKSHGVPFSRALNLAKKAMHEVDTNKIGANVMDLVNDVLEEKEALPLVEKDLLPFRLVEKAVKESKKAGTSIEGLVGEALEYTGGVNEENLIKARESITAVAEDFLKGDDLDEALERDENLKEDKEISDEEIIQAKDSINAFLLFMANQATKDFSSIPHKEILNLAKIAHKVEKKLSQFE